MSWLDFYNPKKRRWWCKEEWVKVKRNQKVYKVAEKHNCPSWDLEFYIFDKYKHKDTCEERWRKRRRAIMFDQTIFEAPEEYVKDLGKSDNHYILMDEIEIYDGPDYEDK